MDNGIPSQALLPLGSVVLLRGAQKKLMIYGRKQIHQENNQMYDYLGVVYPEGYIDPNYTFLFNHEDIDSIEFKGFFNSEEEQFQKILSEVSATS
ncbi:DUF4176 domain-containing protein [Paenibacillus cellulositrophicus]|uniref:DUF4176 domain-containing protein n=1 Tax=Paenibacillus cellulositrophicus TaxID=562959 RepID=UPI003F7EE09B